jgi:hypothetical protein
LHLQFEFPDDVTSTHLTPEAIASGVKCVEIS